jgi:high-affinity Fe2+/Pb2+ permease
MANPNRSFVEKLIAQWPGALGLLSAAIGIFIIWQVHQGGRNSTSRAGLGFIVIGLVLVGYWALANRDDGYNF